MKRSSLFIRQLKTSLALVFIWQGHRVDVLHAFKFNFELKLNFGHKFGFHLSTHVEKLHEKKDITFRAMHLDVFFSDFWRLFGG